MSFETLMASVPDGSKYKRLLSDAHAYGYDEGYDEGRAETLFKLWKQLTKPGARPRSWLLDQYDKLVEMGRWPEGVNRIED